MTNRIDLPGGGWADIKTPAQLTNRDRKLLRRHALGAFSLRGKISAAGIAVDAATVQDVPDSVAERIGAALNPDDLDLLDRVQAAFIVVYTAGWSLDLALPTMDTVDDLPGPIFDALAKATGALGDGTVDTSVSVDAASPTPPSGG